MIEIIQEGQAKPTIKLPRNLRQIGSPNEKYKIYVEDFVYTFLHPSNREETGDFKVAALVGRQEEENSILYYFVKGAFYIEEIEFEKGIPQFTEEIWGYIYKQMKEYFDDEDPDKSLQILGWAFITGGMPPRLTTEIERTHRMNFKEANSLLLLLDDIECEENFYVYEKGSLRKKEGYYIFYEQNPKMQEYMVQYRERTNPSATLEVVVDEVAKNYREKFTIEERPKKKQLGVIGYAACAVLVLSTLVMGVNSIGSYEKMNQLQEAVSLIAGNFKNEEQMEKKDVDEMAVTTVDGDVEPLDETVETSAKSNNEKKEEEKKEKEVKKEKEEKKETTEEKTVEETAQEPSEAETILAQGYYIVKNGDSLESISTKIYGNTSRVSKMKELNGIENADNIFAGQKLILP
ncbi:MAG: LysM peptidoglycan-binding domain-containing protein [Lachnospiraceae bacterium]|nr:LysM peptidoglycan-binding domain-containing protein [Lachnospiraceae bacterium]